MADRNTRINGKQIKDATITADELASSIAGSGIGGGAGFALSVNVDDSSVEVSGDSVQVKDAGITASKLAAAVAGDGLAGGAGAALSINVDSSSIEINADSLRVKSGGITDAMLAGSISDGNLTEDYVKTSEVDDSSIEFSGGTLNIKANGVGATEIDLTGTYDYSSSGTIKVGTPTADTEAANKAYVDSIASGLDIKAACRVASTVALTVTYANGTAGVGATLTNNDTQAAISIDGVALSADDRVLIKDQAVADQEQNGIYKVTTVGTGSTNWVLTRVVDYDESSEVNDSTFFFVQEGTDNADNGYVQINAVATMGTDDIEFEQFSGAGQITAGDGLAKSGNVLSVNVDSSSIEISGDALRVKSSGVTDGMLSVDYVKVSEVDESTLDSASGSLLRVKALGVDTAQLANDSVDKDKIAADVAGDALGQNANGSLEVKVDGSSIETNTDALRVKALGITNAMLAGSIANSKLDSIADSKLVEDYIKVTEVDGSSIEFGSSLNVKDLGITNAMLANDSILEAKLKSSNAPTDGYVLSFNNATGGFTWISGTADSIKESDLVIGKLAPATGGETTLSSFSGSAAVLANSVQIFLNGIIQEEGAGNDYTIVVSTGVVTFGDALDAGDIVLMNGILDN